MKKAFFWLLLVVVVGGAIFYRSAVEDFVSKVASTREVSLMFVGDVMLSRHIGELIDQHNPNFPFELIAEITRTADITFANLENPVSSRGRNIGSIYSFRADPQALAGLEFAGFDVVSLANNHIWDYGEEAFLDTLKHLKEFQIEFVGAGLNYHEANQPKIIVKNNIRVAYLAYTDLTLPFLIGKDSNPSVAFSNLDVIEQAIKAVRREDQADIIVVSFHWGNEYQTTPTVAQKQLAQAVIDAGANIIIGHHPHVVQPVEYYRGGLIAYSLGNFIFDQNFSQDTGWGLILEVVVNKDGLVSVHEKPVKFNKQFQPVL